jgi:hypothetical protein
MRPAFGTYRYGLTDQRCRQGQALHAGDAAAGTGGQAAGGGLGEHAGAGRPDGGGQPGVQQATRGAAAAGPVAARGRRCDGGGGQLAAGVVEVVAVRRVRRLVRAQAALERHAVAFQPGQHGHAAVAEVPEGSAGHGVADLGAQVGEHRLGRVGDPGRALLRRAAARVDDTSGQRGGAAAGEPVEDEHRSPGRGRLQGGARACRPEAHDNDVGLDVPVSRQGGLP